MNDITNYYKNFEPHATDYPGAWPKKAQTIQWDYKNIVKRKGESVRLEVGE